MFPPVPFAFAPNNERISVLFKVVVDARKGFSYTLDDAEDCVYDSYRQMQNIAPSERNREKSISQASEKQDLIHVICKTKFLLQIAVKPVIQKAFCAFLDKGFAFFLIPQIRMNADSERTV